MATTWIVTADSSRARVLQVAGRERLVEIETLLNPDGRLDDRDAFRRHLAERGVD